jgi:adenosylcobinamide-GDP ribazoletransferase
MRVLDSGRVGAAAGFLTRLPIGRRAAPDDLVRGAVLFPLVGAAIGACVGGTALAAAAVLPPLIAGCVAVAVELALTGALHADGLADSADGLAGRDREHSLAIMRDHALGTYGGAALALDLVLKAAALGALAQDDALLPIVAAFALSRAVALPLAATLPYARADDGTGRLLARRVSRGRAIAAAALATALTLAVLPWLAAAAAIGCAIAVATAVATATRRRLGGVTGDVMGAAIELTATLALVVLVALEP